MASRPRSHPQAAAAGPQPPQPLLPCRSSNPCSSAEDRHDHLTPTGKSSWLGRARGWRQNAVSDPSAHAAAWLWLRPGERWPRHTGATGLARAQEYPAHGSLYRTGAGSVQELLALIGLNCRGPQVTAIPTHTPKWGTHHLAHRRQAAKGWRRKKGASVRGHDGAPGAAASPPPAQVRRRAFRRSCPKWAKINAAGMNGVAAFRDPLAGDRGRDVGSAPRWNGTNCHAARSSLRPARGRMRSLRRAVRKPRSPRLAPKARRRMATRRRQAAPARDAEIKGSQPIRRPPAY